MAYRTNTRGLKAEKQPKQPNTKTMSDIGDEITLRDEILDLKKQIMMLKKTNEQNVIKLRKYEDESKRKDRQIEQLMDPNKNVDVRKILSTKGAAILINLKDQNDALIQMVLDKDVQIKRLQSELKISRLYSRTSRSEPYKAEITRLRNLLIKSQEIVKQVTEVTDRHQHQKRTTPGIEVSSSSTQSSPRELEELQFTIHSLEAHMKYSNELLANKNQEIMILTDELNTARSKIRCNTCQQKVPPKQVYDIIYKDYDWFDTSAVTPTAPLSYLSAERKLSKVTVEETLKKIPSTSEILGVFEKPSKKVRAGSATSVPKKHPLLKQKERSKSMLSMVFKTDREPSPNKLKKQRSLISELVMNEGLEESETRERKKNPRLEEIEYKINQRKREIQMEQEENRYKEKWKVAVSKLIELNFNLPILEQEETFDGSARRKKYMSASEPKKKKSGKKSKEIETSSETSSKSKSKEKSSVSTVPSTSTRSTSRDSSPRLSSSSLERRPVPLKRNKLKREAPVVELRRSSVPLTEGTKEESRRSSMQEGTSEELEESTNVYQTSPRQDVDEIKTEEYQEEEPAVNFRFATFIDSSVDSESGQLMAGGSIVQVEVEINTTAPIDSSRKSSVDQPCDERDDNEGGNDYRCQADDNDDVIVG